MVACVRRARSLGAHLYGHIEEVRHPRIACTEVDATGAKAVLTVRNLSPTSHVAFKVRV